MQTEVEPVQNKRSLAVDAHTHIFRLDGSRNDAATHFYVSNDYVLDLAKRSSKVLAGCSIKWTFRFGNGHESRILSLLNLKNEAVARAAAPTERRSY